MVCINLLTVFCMSSTFKLSNGCSFHSFTTRAHWSEDSHSNLLRERSRSTSATSLCNNAAFTFFRSSSFPLLANGNQNLKVNETKNSKWGRNILRSIYQNVMIGCLNYYLSFKIRRLEFVLFNFLDRPITKPVKYMPILFTDIRACKELQLDQQAAVSSIQWNSHF